MKKRADRIVIELKPYYDLARNFNYKIFSIIVENRAMTKSIHNDGAMSRFALDRLSI